MAVTTQPGSAAYTGDNPLIRGLFSGAAWSAPGAAPPRIDYALRSGTDPLGFNDIPLARSWFADEAAALDSAMESWAAVAAIDSRRTTDTDIADIWYWLGTIAEVDALGWHELPGPGVVEPLYGAFAHDGPGWTDAGLQPGGLGFVTVVHEIGHGLGLAHPHDAGGDSTVFPGVTADFDDYGDFDLNQGIFSVMSYNDGWPSEFPDHAATVEDWGYSMGPMALDIAAVQAIYGPNLGHATGDDVYALPDENGVGTGWRTIWDAGGRDVVSAAGTTGDAVLDLRAAPLTGPDAGGHVSRVAGIVGGLTIAAGVTIEDAEGGQGDDRIIGNAADNLLAGGGGDDTLAGGGGADTLDGGEGADRAVFDVAFAEVTVTGDADALDIAAGGAGAARLLSVETLEFRDVTLTAQAALDTGADDPSPPDDPPDDDTADDPPPPEDDDGPPPGIGDGLAVTGGEGRDTLVGSDGDDVLTGGLTEWDLRDRIFGGDGDDLIDGGAGNDELRGDAGNDTLRGGFGVDELFGGAGDDQINGGAFSDLIFGGPGADFINGGFGSDRVNGGDGADTFFHLGISDHGSDWIQDFDSAEGDVLRFGQPGATAADFVLQIDTTPGAGAAGVAELFVVHRSTGQIVWALVDGAANDSLLLQTDGDSAGVDLLA